MDDKTIKAMTSSGKDDWEKGMTYGQYVAAMGGNNGRTY